MTAVEFQTFNNLCIQNRDGHIALEMINAQNDGYWLSSAASVQHISPQLGDWCGVEMQIHDTTNSEFVLGLAKADWNLLRMPHWHSVNYAWSIRDGLAIPYDGTLDYHKACHVQENDRLGFLIDDQAHILWELDGETVRRSDHPISIPFHVKVCAFRVGKIASEVSWIRNPNVAAPHHGDVGLAIDSFEVCDNHDESVVGRSDDEDGHESADVQCYLPEGNAFCSADGHLVRARDLQQGDTIELCGGGRAIIANIGMHERKKYSLVQLTTKQGSVKVSAACRIGIPGQTGATRRARELQVCDKVLMGAREQALTKVLRSEERTTLVWIRFDPDLPVETYQVPLWGLQTHGEPRLNENGNLDEVASQWSLLNPSLLDVTQQMLEETNEDMDEETYLPAVAANSPLPVALIFPGEGSQYKGMLKAAVGIPAVDAMLKAATQIMGWDVKEMALRGSDQQVADPKVYQTLVFVSDMVAIEIMRSGEFKDIVDQVQAVAGKGVGEYAAICAAGILEFPTCLKLVKLLGESTQEVFELTHAKKIILCGLDHATVGQLCNEAIGFYKDIDPVCHVAEELFPNAFSVVGTKDTISEFKSLAERAGALLARIVPGSPFNSPLMAPALVKLEAAIDGVKDQMQPPRRAIYFNANAEKVAPGTDPALFYDLMKKQITSKALWEGTIKQMINDGVTDFYECGPMNQLKAMMKRIDQNAYNRTVSISV